jgi:hypothetical protein
MRKRFYHEEHEGHEEKTAFFLVQIVPTLHSQIVPTLRVGTCGGRSASTEAAGAAAGVLPCRAWEQDVKNLLP